MNTISVIRFLYLIEVCALHFVMIFVKNKQILTISPSINEFFKGLLIFQTYYKPAFMLSFISGYLFFLNVNNENFKEKIKEKMLKRFNSVLVPFLIWNSILFIVFNIIKSSIVTNTDLLIIEQPPSINISNFLLSFINPPFGLWFFQNLVLFYLLSPLIYLIFRDKKNTYLFLLCITFVSIFDFFPSFMYKKFIFSYLLGAYISISGVNFKDIKLKYYNVVALIIMIITLLYCIYNFPNNIYNIIMVLIEDVVLIVLNIIVFVVIKPLFIKIGNMDKIAPILQKFSKASFYIFIFHGMLLSLIVKIVFPKLTKMYSPNILYDIVLFSVTFLFMLSICFLLNQLSVKFKNIHALLTGNR